MKNLVREKIKSFIKKRYGTFVTANITTLDNNKLLSGRNALVTGGTAGIGKAIVESFLQAGANVVFTSRTEEKAHIIQEEFEKKYPGKHVFGIKMDMKDVESFKLSFELVLEKIGSVCWPE